jgi:hypothetical protein
MSMESLVQELLLQEMHSPELLKEQWGRNHLRWSTVVVWNLLDTTQVQYGSKMYMQIRLHSERILRWMFQVQEPKLLNFKSWFTRNCIKLLHLSICAIAGKEQFVKMFKDT